MVTAVVEAASGVVTEADVEVLVEAASEVEEEASSPHMDHLTRSTVRYLLKHRLILTA